MNSNVGLILAVLAFTFAVDGLQLTVSPSERQYVADGTQNFKLNCGIDQGLMFIVKGTIKWFFQPSANEAELELTSQGSSSVTDDNVEVKMDTDSDLAVDLTLLNIERRHNGIYTCRANDGLGEEQEASVEVVVLRPIDRVELVIDNARNIVGEETDVYEEDVRQSPTKIACTSFGSNPNAKVHLMIGDERIPLSGPVVNIPQGTPPTYMSTATAAFRLIPIYNNQRLKCHAELDVPSNVEGFQPFESSIPVRISTIEPIITCGNQTKSLGDKYVTLTCDVASKYPLSKVYWELGHSKEILYPGDRTDDHTEVRVEPVEGDDTRQKVILEIFNMEDKHFDSIFYLIVESASGEIFKEPVFIREMAGGNERVHAMSLVLVLFVAVFTSWFS